MVLLPPNYLQGANGTDCKLTLYVSVRVVKYLDETQQELGLYPWADQMNGPWVVAIGLGTKTHYAAAFCM